MRARSSGNDLLGRGLEDDLSRVAGAYALYGGGEAYFWVVVACSTGSLSYALAKAAAMLPRHAVTVAVPEAMIGLSLTLAVAHLAVAYRTSCRERRRQLVYRIDVEAVSITN
ncbi:hypothetical protein PR202_gb07318 [Eleusine coracana subsp. coracana]|uniref:Uncharacterized protein n=1 Tax=Eleusine coracana subsp. coracana TaxID=191504 RepID=A0AAV5EB49_ELECO|nr:hypothetical protein PR202_gb07318 [Eleusine coracana subsp. coracana]